MKNKSLEIIVYIFCFIFNFTLEKTLFMIHVKKQLPGSVCNLLHHHVAKYLQFQCEHAEICVRAEIFHKNKNKMRRDIMVSRFIL